ISVLFLIMAVWQAVINHIRKGNLHDFPIIIKTEQTGNSSFFPVNMFFSEYKGMDAHRFFHGEQPGKEYGTRTNGPYGGIGKPGCENAEQWTDIQCVIVEKQMERNRRCSGQHYFICCLVADCECILL